MTISAFIENPRFPTGVGYRSITGPGFSTRVVKTSAGYRQANQQTSMELRVFDLTHSVRDQTEYAELLHFFLAVARGKLNGWRIKDWNDYIADSDEGRLGTTALGTGLPTYQLYKRYTSGANTHYRAIQKPVVGSLVLYRNGSHVSLGSPDPLNTTNGVFTFDPDDSDSITGHTVGANHVFTTASDIGLSIGEKVYLLGVTGTAASLLNSTAHTIGNKSGSGPYTWTLDTSTGGSPTLTASGGTAYAYPQESDVLTATFEFDVPVALDQDEFLAELTDLSLVTPQRITATEIKIALA